MRHGVSGLFAAAFVLFSGSASSAYTTYMILPSVTPWGSSGAALGVGDSLEIEIYFDSDGEANITLLSVGVLFNDSMFSYVGASSPTYALYSPPAKGAIYMVPASTNGELRVGTTNQVNLDWVSSSLPDGNRDPGSFTMAILTFQLDNNWAGTPDFWLSNDSPGNVIQLGDGSIPENHLKIVPEPASALLLGLGLLGLAAARGRQA